MSNLIYELEKIIWSYPLIILLMITHILITFKLRFPQKNIFKSFKYLFESNDKSKISSFNSLMTVLAATIGTGNIIGVATAILVGGIGSVFWIFISRNICYIN
jgi:alanine or glycine:cation symporter, AGCS family